jgi:hypothetical protein
MYFDITFGCKKIYFILLPQKYIFTLQGLCKNSDVITRVPQMLSFKTASVYNITVPSATCFGG